MKKILVTGGAGYIGSVLVRKLLMKGYHVKVLDILNFGGDSLIEVFDNPNFEFVKGDVRKVSDVLVAITDADYVVNLAAIVGDPACVQNPELAKETNFEGTKLLYEVSNAKNVRKFIFASTCSNYGKMKDNTEFVDENSELAPVSLYAETKVNAELFLLSQNKDNVCKPTCLRFSTVYGLSPRMRFDLTVNEFVREMEIKKELIVFGEQFWRPYCHVIDLANSIVTVIEADTEKTAFNVFNVGDTNENYQKKMIVAEINKIIPDALVKYVNKNEDPRDYRVSFEKIKSELNFNITMKVPFAIKNIKQAIENNIFTNPYDKKYQNI